MDFDINSWNNITLSNYLFNIKKKIITIQITIAIEYKCKKEVMPNVWHNNLIIDGKIVKKENSEVPSSLETIID